MGSEGDLVEAQSYGSCLSLCEVIEVTEEPDEEVLEIPSAPQLEMKRRAVDIMEVEHSAVDVPRGALIDEPFTTISETDLFVESVKKVEKEEKKKKRPPLDLETILRRNIVGHGAIIRRVGAAIRRNEMPGWCDEDEGPLVFFHIPTNNLHGAQELGWNLAAYRNKATPGKGYLRVNMKNYRRLDDFCKMVNVKGLAECGNGDIYNIVETYPAAVILLHNITKVEKPVMNTLLKIFKEGIMISPDAEPVDCKQAIFILSDDDICVQFDDENDIREKLSDNEMYEYEPTVECQEDYIKRELLKHFDHEFLRRVDEFLFMMYILEVDNMNFLHWYLEALAETMLDAHSLTLTWNANVLDQLLYGRDGFYTEQSLKKNVKYRIVSPLALAEQRGIIYRGCKVHVKVGPIVQRVSPSNTQGAIDPCTLIFQITTPKGTSLKLNPDTDFEFGPNALM